MAEPYHFAQALIGAKHEVTPGTKVALAGANIIDAENIDLTPVTGNVISRNVHRMHFTSPREVLANAHRMLSFRAPITKPTVADVPSPIIGLLESCYLARQVGAPVPPDHYQLKPIDKETQTSTLGVYVDGDDAYFLRGGQGNFSLVFEADNYPYADFNFLGLWDDPLSATVAPIPDFDGWLPPVPVGCSATMALQVGSNTYHCVRFELQMGLTLSHLCVGALNKIFASRRQTRILARVIDKGVAAHDVVTEIRNRTEHGVQYTHAGMTIAAPKAQISGEGKFSDWKGVRVRDLLFIPHETLGNDEFTITEQLLLPVI